MRRRRWWRAGTAGSTLVFGALLAASWLAVSSAVAQDGPVTVAPSPELVAHGEELFTHDLTPEQGLGPFINGTACTSCHSSPRVGGMGNNGLATVTRIGRAGPGGFDPMDGQGGPVERVHGVTGLRAACLTATALPRDVDIRSVRNSPPLFGAGLIDQIADETILAQAVPRPGGIHGHANLVTDATGRQRVGRFGWKADTATLEQMVADALRNEHGVTSPLAPSDIAPPGRQVAGCPSSAVTPEDDGSSVEAIAAYLTSLQALPSEPDPVGEQLFAQVGCSGCHTPSLPTAAGEARLYSDLLLHDMGPGLDDGVVQGQATRRDWRTTPLWGLRERQRFLHDGKARSIEAAIGAHSGEASTSSHHYANLPPAEREALRHFLETR